MTDPFSVVRQAHRIYAAYYQQILPLIYATAQDMNTTFITWDTWSFCKPPQRNKNPFEAWKWDFLPIMDLSFAFSRQKQPGASMTTDDFVLDFHLVTDSELSSDQRVKQYGENVEPDATALNTSAERAESYLCVYLFAAARDKIYDSPYNLWNSYSGYPMTDSAIHLSDDKNIKGIGFRLNLHEIAHDEGRQLLLNKINENLTILQIPLSMH
ncbi:hypothetical protein [Siccibacter colletis]|uniref:hypothetical protein n=1 Tax=Siccibacter colletis TaxID=1505757 RepID=UPI00068CB7DB|nr:hypothetical protein [Siccibacter colletis]